MEKLLQTKKTIYNPNYNELLATASIKIKCSSTLVSLDKDLNTAWQNVITTDYRPTEKRFIKELNYEVDGQHYL